MTQRSAAYWQGIATERLRMLWIAAHAHGGKLGAGKSFAVQYPGDDRAIVTSYTDPEFGDFVIEARVVGELSVDAKETK